MKRLAVVCLLALALPGLAGAEKPDPAPEAHGKRVTVERGVYWCVYHARYDHSRWHRVGHPIYCFLAKR